MSRWGDVADWIGPTVNRTADAMGAVQGVVLHVQEGTEAGTESWMRNPASQVSSHFLAPKQGRARQMVDTADKAWCEAAGNPRWISIECEGYHGQALTADQVETCAQVLARAHREYGVPLASTDDPAGRGLGWHGMGGAAWGGHYDCPGEPIKAQRPAIVARAAAILNGVEDDMGTLDGIDPYDRATPQAKELRDLFFAVVSGYEDDKATPNGMVARLRRIEAAVGSPATFTDEQVAALGDRIGARIAAPLAQLVALLDAVGAAIAANGTPAGPQRP